MGFFSTLQTDFKVYIRSSVPAFAAVFIGVLFVSPSLGPLLYGMPVIARIFRPDIFAAVLAGSYAVVGNLLAQRVSH